jgi:formyl-CoA transferase
MMTPYPAASTALDRFTVLDLARVRSGPTCVRQLAHWGARVLRVELPERLEPDGGADGDRHGSDFQNLHRNKRSLTLNLKDPEGLAILLRLVERADVLVENYRPSVKHRLGIDYEQLREINPRLVYASISGFGQDGPYSDRPGFDQVAQGMGGLMSITGEPGRGPMRAGIPIADLTSGIFAAYGILVALLEREVSGIGQWVQTSLLQAQIFMLDFQAARWTMSHEVAGQAGNDHPTYIPTGVFETSDGHVNIAVAGQPIWQRFCEAIGAPEWVDHARYRDQASRSTHRALLNAAINERTRLLPSEYWLEKLNGAGVPCGPILRIDQVFEDPQVRHLGMTQAVDSPVLGEISLLGQPVELSRTPSRLATPPPERGEHTEEVLAELGFDQEARESLRARGVV